jgi:hypothetical protein
VNPTNSITAATAIRGARIAFEKAEAEDVLDELDAPMAEDVLVVEDAPVVEDAVELPTETGVTEVSTCSPRTCHTKMS